MCGNTMTYQSTSLPGYLGPVTSEKASSGALIMCVEFDKQHVDVCGAPSE